MTATCPETCPSVNGSPGVEAANGRFRGVRQRAKWDPDPAVRGPVSADAPGLYLQPEFGKGLDLLASMGSIVFVFALAIRTAEFVFYHLRAAARPLPPPRAERSAARKERSRGSSAAG